MTEKQKEMVRHAYGASSKSPGFRSYYSTELNDPDMMALVELGFFNPKPYTALMTDGYGVFFLTEKGKQLAKASNDKI